jgi:hypothetical protein
MPPRFNSQKLAIEPMACARPVRVYRPVAAYARREGENMTTVNVMVLSICLLLIGWSLHLIIHWRKESRKLQSVSTGFLASGGLLLLAAVVVLTWPLVLGLAGVAAVIWLILYAFGREARPPR